MSKKIPQVWLDWILENISLGVDLDDIYYTLVQNGFKKKEINSVLNNYKPKKKLDDSLLDKDKLIKKNVEEFKKTFKEIPSYTEIGFSKQKLPKEIQTCQYQSLGVKEKPWGVDIIDHHSGSDSSICSSERLPKSYSKTHKPKFWYFWGYF